MLRINSTTKLKCASTNASVCCPVSQKMSACFGICGPHSRVRKATHSSNSRFSRALGNSAMGRRRIDASFFSAWSGFGAGASAVDAALKLQWSPGQIVGHFRVEGLLVPSHKQSIDDCTKTSAAGGTLYRYTRIMSKEVANATAAGRRVGCCWVRSTSRSVQPRRAASPVGPLGRRHRHGPRRKTLPGDLIRVGIRASGGVCGHR